MQRYGTALVEDDAHTKVITKPKKTSRTYVYPFHRHRGVWVLSRGRDWYTQHALGYAEREIDGDVLRRHMPPEQTELDDFHDNGGGGVQSESALIATGEAD